MLETMEREGLPLATTAINILELYRGACLSASAQENIREVEAIIRALIELPITDETCRIFGALAAELRGNGKPIGDFDEVIAAITLAGDGELVIRDHHFARVPGLKDQDVLRSRAGGVVRGPRNRVRPPGLSVRCMAGAPAALPDHPRPITPGRSRFMINLFSSASTIPGSGGRL